jgi:hypothetical protein
MVKAQRFYAKLSGKSRKKLEARGWRLEAG